MRGGEAWQQATVDVLAGDRRRAWRPMMSVFRLLRRRLLFTLSL